MSHVNIKNICSRARGPRENTILGTLDRRNVGLVGVDKSELDLRHPGLVDTFFERMKIDCVF